MSAIEAWELVTRIAGFTILAAAWIAAVQGAAAGHLRPPGRSIGLARRFGAHAVYLLGAIPYFAICALLWRALPIDLAAAARVACLLAGSILGAAGAVLYLGGRHALGSMYNVSSSLGSELYADHRLVESGPYALVRHPMYVGLMLAAAGGLLVYRTWTLVFMTVTLVGAVVKAHREELLLAAEFGESWKAYADRVSAWIPSLRQRPTKEVVDDRIIASGT